MGKKRKKKKKLARQADPHALYQLAVQSPIPDIEFFERAYREIRGERPLALREDFCGTAYLSTEWAKSHPQRSAVGVDVDDATLSWGKEHNVGSLPPGTRARVRLLSGDVRVVESPASDITCAMNFSHCVFKRRAELKTYFERVYERLAPDGVFICELYGGTEAIVEIEEERTVENFVMSWDQEAYNPITHETLCHINFKFPDGSRLDRAFSYDWRLWTVPETRELLDEAGFAESRVFWEQVGEEGEGTGEYERTEVEENQETWLVYVVAAR